MQALRAPMLLPRGQRPSLFVAMVLRQRRARMPTILGDASISWRFTLSLTVPNEHVENTGTRKRRYPEEPPPALDLLENAIRRLRTDVHRGGRLPSGRFIGAISQQISIPEMGCFSALKTAC